MFLCFKVLINLWSCKHIVSEVLACCSDVGFIAESLWWWQQQQQTKRYGKKEAKGELICLIEDSGSSNGLFQVNDYTPFLKVFKQQFFVQLPVEYSCLDTVQNTETVLSSLVFVWS